MTTDEKTKEDAVQEIEEGVKDADLRAAIHSIAAGAKARERELRGAVQFSPRHDLDGVEVTEVAGGGEGGALPGGRDRSWEDLEDTAAEALQATGEFLATQAGVTPPPEDKSPQVARSWLRVLELYAEIDPRVAAASAAVASTIAWAGPSALEYYLRAQVEAEENQEPETESPSDVAEREAQG